METSRKQRRQLQSVFEPGFKQMLLVSVLLHLLLPVLYYTPFFPQREIEKPPVYRVNLVNKIVKNPQAGRPEAAPVKKKPLVKPKSKTKPTVKPKSIPPKSKPAPVKSKPVPKSDPKPISKPASVKKRPEIKPKQKIQSPSKQAKDNQISAIMAIRAKIERQREIDRLKAQARELTQQSKSPITDAPVGMVGGTGDEAGVSAVAFVQEFIQQQWRFSSYQKTLKNPEAEVDLYYSSNGILTNYDFVKSSGDFAFDESLKRAILKSKDLGQKFPLREKITVIFNLKNMLD